VARPKNERLKTPKNKHPEPGVQWLEDKNCWLVRVAAFGTRHTKTFSNLSEARDWKAKTKATPPQPAKAAPIRESMTVAAWIDRYIETLERNSRMDPVNGLAPSTIAGYKQKLTMYVKPHLGERLLADLEPLMLEDWVQVVQNKNTVNAAWEAYRRLKGCLTAAVRAKVIQFNPCADWQPPRGTRSKKARGAAPGRWTDEEANRVFEYLESPESDVNPHRHMWRTWLGTGLRKNELAGLPIAVINLEMREFEVRNTVTHVRGHGMLQRGKTKTGKARIVPFDDYVLDAITKQLERRELLKAARPNEWQESGLLFCGERGQPLHVTTMRKWFKKLCKAAGVREIRPYDVRSTHGSALHFKLGMDAVLAAERLGHSVETYLNTYVRTLEAERSSSRVDTQKLYSVATKRQQNPSDPPEPIPLELEKPAL
jgi:integrase